MDSHSEVVSNSRFLAEVHRNGTQYSFAYQVLGLGMPKNKKLFLVDISSLDFGQLMSTKRRMLKKLEKAVLVRRGRVKIMERAELDSQNTHGPREEAPDRNSSHKLVPLVVFHSSKFSVTFVVLILLHIYRKA